MTSGPALFPVYFTGMAIVVQLQINQRPPVRERYAMVLDSGLPPARAVEFVDHSCGRTYFAGPGVASVEHAIKRATRWADRQNIEVIYLQRAPVARPVARWSGHAH